MEITPRNLAGKLLSPLIRLGIAKRTRQAAADSQRARHPYRHGTSLPSGNPPNGVER